MWRGRIVVGGGLFAGEDRVVRGCGVVVELGVVELEVGIGCHRLAGTDALDLADMLLECLVGKYSSDRKVCSNRLRRLLEDH